MSSVLLGLISDTHGLLRPQVRDALQGVSLILHAGDVGGHSVLAGLEQIAPVRAVFGNVDPPMPPLQQRLRLTIGGRSVHVSHGHELGSPTPEKLLSRYRADIIVFGHTHRALVSRAGTQLVVNPGSAGPRRFNVKASVARLTIEDGAATVEIVPLDD